MVVKFKWRKDRDSMLDTETCYVGTRTVGRIFYSPFGDGVAWQCWLPQKNQGTPAGREKSARMAKVCVEDEAEEWFDGIG